MKDSIREFIYKIKRLSENREFLFIVLVLLVGFGSFGLGRLSVLSENKTAVHVEYPGNQKINFGMEAGAVYPSLQKDALNSPQSAFVGSKNGSKYHFPWCPGAQRISETNKVWFDSKEEAEKAGYTAATNCKGL